MTKRILKKITTPTSLKRFLFFFLSDILIITLSIYLSFVVHFEFNLNIRYWDLVGEVLPFFIILKVLSLLLFRAYWITWRYVGISDLINIFAALLIAELLLVFLSLPMAVIPALPLSGLSKRIFFVDGIISFFLISALRVSKRVYLETIHEKYPLKKGKRTIIVGAGNAGEMILRDMARNGYEDFYPIGFLDDSPMKVGTYIHGVKVLETTERLEEMIRAHSAQAVIIAIPTLNHKKLKSFYDQAKKAKVETFKIIPRIYDFSRPEINLRRLEDISIEDLVGRQSVMVDYRAIREFIKGKSVLVTGAGGSIGSEIVVQVSTFEPAKVILFDIDETELHNMSLKIQRHFPHLLDAISLVTGDIRDETRIREVFEIYHPHIVFHAAAYKHVPMMEYNPKEAVKVNIFGSYILARAAKNYGVEKFIMISTDKAVRPTSIMGATKRIAEYVCKAYNSSEQLTVNGEGERIVDSRQYAVDSLKTSKQETVNSEIKKVDSKQYAVSSRQKEDTDKGWGTKFVSVRFGNVLGSRGSVLPLFLEQLKYGGPLTVTHKEMRRYFMTIPEAVSLVLQASMMGNGGEVFVLDMGDPVKIVDIAEELIRIHGMKPYQDIDIQFTGLRPGEKLYEEILTAEEGTDASIHEKVFISRNSDEYSLEEIETMLAKFESLIREHMPDSEERVKALLKNYVKMYDDGKDSKQ